MRARLYTCCCVETTCLYSYRSGLQDACVFVCALSQRIYSLFDMCSADQYSVYQPSAKFIAVQSFSTYGSIAYLYCGNRSIALLHLYICVQMHFMAVKPLAPYGSRRPWIEKLISHNLVDILPYPSCIGTFFGVWCLFPVNSSLIYWTFFNIILFYFNFCI